jgi:hypothetical protein
MVRELMNKVLLEQLNMLKTLEFQVDGESLKDFPESFSEVTFFKSDKNLSDCSEKIFKFEDYIIKPYNGFDYHDKFNKGVPPPEKVMQGCIVKETEKMYYLRLHSTFNNKTWEGWCPKKSVEEV